MLEIIIHVLEGLVASLTALLFFRVYKLADSEKASPIPVQVREEADEAIVVDMPAKGDYSHKMHCLKLAQAFAGNQLLDIKRAFTLSQSEQPEWLRQAVSLYLIGAIDFIGKQNRCENNSRKELIEIVLKSNLKINREKAKSFFVDAVCREPQSENDSMVRAGAMAAKSWLENQLVPENYRLKTRVQDWGIVA